MLPLPLLLLLPTLPTTSSVADRASRDVPAVTAPSGGVVSAAPAPLALPTTAPGIEARRSAAKLITDALAATTKDAKDAPSDPAKMLERLRDAVRAARATLGDTALNSARLAAAVDVAPSELEHDAERSIKRVRRALERLALDMVFEPRVEAPRPVGFPAATPVGEVAVLDYPSYRMAKVAMDARGDNGAFWTLFRHIQSHEIAMTAPVEIEYGRDAGDAKDAKAAKSERAGSMAFLYASQDIGKLGADGSVTVVDVPAARVVSTGVRGDPSESRVAAEREELRSWLRDHPEFVECGPARSMGWNSPMVADAQRFTEVQIVVRARVESDAKKP